MSKFIDNAELVKTRLKTAPVEGEIETPTDITGVPTIVYQQKAIDSEIEKFVGKGHGLAVTIFWDGFVTADKNAYRPNLASRYTLTIWAHPTFSKGFTTDAVAQSIINRLWHWNPIEGGHVHSETEVKKGNAVSIGDFVGHTIEIEIPTYL